MVWFSQYNELWEAGEYYSALTTLGRIYEALEELPSSQKVTLTEAVQKSAPSSIILSQIMERAQFNLNRISNILSSGGDRYDADEVLLVLTIRDGLSILTRFLQQAYRIEATLSFSEIDQLIMQRFSNLKLSGKASSLFSKVIN